MLAGSVLVAVSFPFIFMLCRECWGFMGPLYIIMIGFMICVFQVQYTIQPTLTYDMYEYEESSKGNNT